MISAKRSLSTTFDRPFTPGTTEDVRCNFCGCESYSLFLVEQGFEVRHCLDCGLYYVSPQPAAEEMPVICDDMYPGDDAAEVEARSLGLHERKIRGLIAEMLPRGGRLLDVGCGYGLLLQTLSDLPLTVSGLEPSTTAATRAKQALPQADIQVGGVEAAGYPPESFDVITCVAVLEHMKDPLGALRRFHEWLVPDGLLFIQVPWHPDLLALTRLLPFLPFYFEAPHHLFMFPPELLETRCRTIGFQDFTFHIAPVYSSPNKAITAMVWTMKAMAHMLRWLSGGRWMSSLAGSYLMIARKSSQVS